MDPAPPGGAAAQQHPGQPQQPQGAGAAPSSAAAAASGSGAAPLAQLQNALNALHDLTQQQAPGGSGGEALARASAALQEAAVALQAQQPAAAAADADDAAADDGRAAKRARRVLEGPPPDFAYSPEAECDLIIKCGDGKRLGVHGLIVLRSAGLLRELLEACAGEREIAVTEASAAFRTHLLDLLYDRAVQLQPEHALQVFQLADKYEAASLMQACRLVFASDAFKLRMRAPQGEGEGHADWLEVLALASKHGYPELLDKCCAFMQAQCTLENAPTLASFVQGLPQLAELRQRDMFQVMGAWAAVVKGFHAEAKVRVDEVVAKLKDIKGKAEQALKQAEKQKANYSKLLASFNRLVGECDRRGLAFHREIDLKGSGKKLKGKKRAAPAAAPAGAAAAAAQLAAAAAQLAAAAPAAAAHPELEGAELDA